MIETNHHVAENEDGEQTVDHDHFIARSFAGENGTVAECIGVESHEVVVTRETLATLLDAASGNPVTDEEGQYSQDVRDAIDDGEEALGYEDTRDVFLVEYDNIQMRVNEEDARRAFPEWREAMGSEDDQFPSHREESAEWAARWRLAEILDDLPGDVKMEVGECTGVEVIDDET